MAPLGTAFPGADRRPDLLGELARARRLRRPARGLGGVRLGSGRVGGAQPDLRDRGETELEASLPDLLRGRTGRERRPADGDPARDGRRRSRSRDCVGAVRDPALARRDSPDRVRIRRPRAVRAGGAAGEEWTSLGAVIVVTGWIVESL